MPESHTVQAGECLSSIADQHGRFWEDLWNHADNSELKQLRKDPNVLLDGDVVVIPDKEEHQEECASEQKHRFRRKGVPAKIDLRITRDGKPRADLPYVLEIDGIVVKGTTDGDGAVKEDIPPGARAGKLTVGEGDDAEVHELRLGALDPIETDSGVLGRLLDLGYDTTSGLEKAARDFQADETLEVTGTVDDQTREKLKERFGQ